MRKRFRKAISLLLTFALCLSLLSLGANAQPAESPSLDKTEISMLLGGSLETLTVQGVPAGAEITWASDDLRVARVSEGKVISVGEGTANVTATVGDETLTCKVNVYDEDLLITNSVFSKDTDGNPIFAQCGSIYQYKEGEPYYWYGVCYDSTVSYYDSLKNTNGTPGGSGQASVLCYSSYNLVDWTYEGVMCTTGEGNWPTGWFGRIGVVYHEESDTYVLVGQGGSAVAFGYSEGSPTGPFTYYGLDTVDDLLPDGCDTARTGDQTIYYDNRTGKAYIVYCNDGVDGTTGYGQDQWHTLPERGAMYVAELDEDNRFLSIKSGYKIYDTKEDTYYNLRREGGREANCLFYYDGWYYAAASGLAGWNSSPNYYMGGAKSPTDQTYVNEVGLPNNMTPMRGSASNFSNNSQVVGFVTVDTPTSEQAPKGQLVIGLGDRWCNMIGNNTGGHGIGYNVFTPLSFLDPETAEPMTKEDEPKTPNPQQYNYYPDGTKHEDNPYKDMETFYPFIPEGYPYEEWQRPEWDIPVYNSLSQFYLDLENGTWEPGPNNNYLDNPDFEQDRIDKCVDMTLADDTPVKYPVVQDYVNEPNGWKSEHIAGQTAQINYGGNRNNSEADRNWQLIAPGTEDQNWYSAWAGGMTWYHGYTKRNPGTDPYKTKTYQQVDLPDGLYNFYGWVRSSGGQNEAYIYAGDRRVDINEAIDDWKLVTIEDVMVTDGQIEVGFYSDAQADQWVFFDDFALIAAPVETAELSALVDEAQTLEEEAYTADTWAALSEALEEAQETLLNEDARQTWINEAWASLKIAMDALEPIPVRSATAPESAEVNSDFVVSVVTNSSIEDVKLFNENDMALGRKDVQITDNQDGTKTFDITLSVGTVGNGRTFKIVTLGEEGYLIDSGVTVSLNITSVPASLTGFDLPDSAVANQTFIVTATTDLSATKIEVYNENGMKMGLRSLTSEIIDGQKVWTGVMSIGTQGERTFSACAVNKYGARSEALTDTISVKAFA